MGSSSCSLSPEQCSAAATEAELLSSCPVSQKKRLFWACREDQGGDLEVLDHLCPCSAVSPRAVSNELCCLRLVFGDRIFV